MANSLINLPTELIIKIICSHEDTTLTGFRVTLYHYQSLCNRMYSLIKTCIAAIHDHYITTETYEGGGIIYRLFGLAHRDRDEPAVILGLRAAYYQFGCLHREEDKPADIHNDGYMAWYRRGQLHREGDQPAVVTSKQTNKWYRWGQLHRDGGKPAIIRSNGECKWYAYDQLHRDFDLPAWVGNKCNKWYQYGKLHRYNAPAIVHGNGKLEYWEYGYKQYTHQI